MSLGARVRSSVRFRVTAIAALFMFLVLALGSVVVVVMLSHSLGESLVDSARQDAAAIDAQLARGALPQQAAITGRVDVLVQLVDRRGTVVASDRPGLLDKPLLTSPGVVGDRSVPGYTDRYAVVARRATAPGDVSLIVVGRSTEQRDTTRFRASLSLVLAVPVFVAALAVAVWVSIGRALRPVEAMRRDTGQITAAHLPRRLAVPAGHDEIPRLARTLNEMLDRIDEGQQRQRQFVADASHEFRSPLAVIRQSAEVARAHPDRVAVEELADGVLEESARLEALVRDLLLLARMEGESVGTRELVDLDDVVLVEVDRIRTLAPTVHVDVSGVSAGQVAGSPALLGHVVRNLLVNAVRHAVSRVAVTLEQHGDVVRLVVDDDGAGIPADHRDAVFERFVRLDEARARDEGGSGLGLAIVRSIVHDLDGMVTVSDAPLGGARFEVLLSGS